MMSCPTQVDKLLWFPQRPEIQYYSLGELSNISSEYNEPRPRDVTAKWYQGIIFFRPFVCVDSIDVLESNGL